MERFSEVIFRENQADEKAEQIHRTMKDFFVPFSIQNPFQQGFWCFVYWYVHARPNSNWLLEPERHCSSCSRRGVIFIKKLLNFTALWDLICFDIKSTERFIVIPAKGYLPHDTLWWRIISFWLLSCGTQEIEWDSADSKVAVLQCSSTYTQHTHP